MTPFRIIALAGAAGSGKDTAANCLAERYGFAKAMFAGPLKAGLCAMFGWPKAMLDNREWKEAPMCDIGKSPRQLMQTLGTEWGRQLVHQNLWLLLAARAINEARFDGLSGIVFSDCRFENEAAWVLSKGGSVVHLARPGTQAVSAHASEHPLPSSLVTAQIINDASVDQLRARLFEFVNSLLEESI